MCSRRDACESITTRRRLRPVALLPEALPLPPRAAAGFGWDDPLPAGSEPSAPGLADAGFLVAGASSATDFEAACAPSAPADFRALSASDSSTLDAATF